MLFFLCSRDSRIGVTCFMSGFMLVCICYRQRAETENTPILAFPQEIVLLLVCRNTKRQLSINVSSEIGGPTGNILSSLRFWAHFQWTVCGKAQIRFLNAPLPCWLHLSVSLCDPHICVALPQTDHVFMMPQAVRKFAGWFISCQPQQTHALMNCDSCQRIWN